MRKKITKPQKGDIRTRSGFLWLPRCIGEDWRWLEKATWTQLRTVEMDFCDAGGPLPIEVWLDQEWIDNDQHRDT